MVIDTTDSATTVPPSLVTIRSYNHPDLYTKVKVLTLYLCVLKLSTMYSINVRIQQTIGVADLDSILNRIRAQ